MGVRKYTTVTVREVLPAAGDLLAGGGRKRVEGECQRPRFGERYASFDLCDVMDGQLSTVRVTIGPQHFDRVRAGLGGATGLDLEQCLVSGRVVTVLGSLGEYSGAIRLEADGVFINDPEAIGTVRATLDAIPGELRTRSLNQDRFTKAVEAEWLGLDCPERDGRPRLAVITGERSQALKDFTRAYRQKAGQAFREPRHEVCRLNGPGVAESIAAAIARLNAAEAGGTAPGLDAICIVRGGGPWTDLWPFQSLDLVDAVHASSIPVFTAIGHADDRVAIDCAAEGARDTPGTLGQDLGLAALSAWRQEKGTRPSDHRKARAPQGEPGPETAIGLLTRQLEEASEALTEAESARRREQAARAEADRVRRVAEAALGRARAEREHLARAAERARVAALHQGARAGERAAVHRASEIAVVVTALVSLLAGGLALITGEIVLVLFALAGLVGAIRLGVELRRTAPGRDRETGSSPGASKTPTVV